MLCLTNRILDVMLFRTGFELPGVGWNLNSKAARKDVTNEKEMRVRWEVKGH